MFQAFYGFRISICTRDPELNNCLFKFLINIYIQQNLFTSTRILGFFMALQTPLSWLQDFVELNQYPDDLAERLTTAGLEVETIEKIGENWG